MIYILFTLDSHDYVGPFLSKEGLHSWAMEHGFSSYAIEVQSITEPNFWSWTFGWTRNIRGWDPSGHNMP